MPVAADRTAMHRHRPIVRRRRTAGDCAVAAVVSPRCWLSWSPHCSARRPARPSAATARPHTATVGVGLLAGGLRRRDLLLRRRRRSTAPPATSTSTSRSWAWPGPANSGGYWLVASDGGIFAFGNAAFYGSTGGHRTSTSRSWAWPPPPTARGYWLVASDGGIFSFGNAAVLRLDGRPPPQPADRGHGRHARRAGVLAGGRRRRHLLLRRRPLLRLDRQHPPQQAHRGDDRRPRRHGLLVHRLRRRRLRLRRRRLLRLAGQRAPEPAHRGHHRRPPTAAGYWFTNNNGAVTAYGDATYWGSAPQVINRPVVGMAEADAARGSFTGSSYPSGSYGYDISNYQCRATLPPVAPHHRGGRGGRCS